MAIGQAAVGSKVVDPTAPAKLFLQGVESLTSASSAEEAATRGTVAAAVLILSSLSSEDPNTSLSFGGFLLILAQNVLFPGSQIIFSKGLLKFYVIKNILIRVITEIQIERKRRKLKLPRARFKFKIFRKQEDNAIPGIIFSMKQVFLSAFVCKILGDFVPNLSQEGCDY